MWKPAWCNGKAVFVNCDASGNPVLNDKGQATTRYQNKDGAKEYTPILRNVSFTAPPKSKADQLTSVEFKKPEGRSRWETKKEPKVKQPPKKRQRLDKAGAAADAPPPASDAIFQDQAQRMLASAKGPVWYVFGELGWFRVATSDAAGQDWKEHQESTGPSATANLSTLMGIERALEFAGGGGGAAVVIVTCSVFAYQACNGLRAPSLPQNKTVSDRIIKVLASTRSQVNYVNGTVKLEGLRRCMAFAAGGASKKRKAA